MTEPSQYFKGRTVQEQMNEVIGYVDTRTAEVATDAIASDVAQVHQDMLDADADAQAAAASAAAAAGTLANAVKKTGEASQSIAGNIAVSGNLSGGVVTGTKVTVPTPVNNTDAANKKYVDDQDALDVKLAGSQAITGIKTAPLEATGTYSDQIASSNKVKNELDNYALVVRTTGSQIITGAKTFRNSSTNAIMDIQHPSVDVTGTIAAPQNVTYIKCGDKNDVNLCSIMIQRRVDGGATLYAVIRNADGTNKFVNLASGDL